MPMPIGTITGQTATGDIVSGPGVPTILVKSLPVSVVGDMVAGAVCLSGSITMSSSKVMCKSKPAACMTSMITGSGPPPLCPPVSTTVMSKNATILV